MIKTSEQERIFQYVILFVLLLVLWHCSGKTEEDKIIDMMKNIGKFAEKKDINNVMKYITGDFMDFQGRGKTEIRGMIIQYFRDFRGIVINVLSTRIDNILGEEAHIQTDVALSSGAAKVLRKIVNISTDNYRLKLGLINRDKKWKIKSGEWKSIGRHELFPESLSILDRIFR
jgi:hypothetical protein